MSTFAIPAGIVVLDGFGGKPLDPQPATLDVAAAAIGVIGRYPDGSERNIAAPSPPPTDQQMQTAQIDEKLAALNAKLSVSLTSGRGIEDLWRALKSINADVPAFVQEILDESETLRSQRAALYIG